MATRLGGDVFRWSTRRAQGRSGEWAGRLSTRLGLDKLQLTVFVNRRIRSISFGVSDLNGVAY